MKPELDPTELTEEVQEKPKPTQIPTNLTDSGFCQDLTKKLPCPPGNTTKQCVTTVANENIPTSPQSDSEATTALGSSCELLHIGEKSSIWRTVSTKASVAEVQYGGEDVCMSNETLLPSTSPRPEVKTTPMVVKRYSSNNDRLASPELFVELNILKEIRLLKLLRHDNIVTFLDVIVAESETKNDDNVCVCMESLDTDLGYFYDRGTKIVDTYHACLLLYQALRALKYIHFSNVCHGNLKLSTMLVNVETLELKICDFQNSVPVTQTAISTDIQDIFAAFEKLFADQIVDSSSYQKFRTRQLSSLNILLNNSYFQDFGLYDGSFDEPNQVFSGDNFDWNELYACCPMHGSIDTLIHLISLEGQQQQRATSSVFSNNTMTSVDRAVACELEHGVMCGDTFSPTRLRFEISEQATASPLDINNHVSIPAVPGAVTSNDIFKKMFGTPPVYKAMSIGEEPYDLCPERLFKPITGQGAPTPEFFIADEHPSEDEDVLCAEVRIINHDRPMRFQPDHTSTVACAAFETSMVRTPHSSLSSGVYSGSTQSVTPGTRHCSISPYHSANGKSFNKQRSSTAQSCTSSTFLYDIGCGNADGLASANDNVVACSILDDEPYDHCGDWLASFK